MTRRAPAPAPRIACAQLPNPAPTRPYLRLDITLAKVDATEEPNKPLSERFGVKGFPTLKIFRKGQAEVEYQGPRETVRPRPGLESRRFASNLPAPRLPSPRRPSPS